jgi:hypothetical protein
MKLACFGKKRHRFKFTLKHFVSLPHINDLQSFVGETHGLLNLLECRVIIEKYNERHETQINKK